MSELLSNRIFITVLLVGLASLLKIVTAKVLKKRALKTDSDNRYLVNNLKNLINLVLIVAVFALWTPEIQSFAISIAAFVVAIVLATKEIIQCFIGFIYLSSTNPYRVGDWIQVGDVVGEVSETDWAKVTLLEVDVAGYGYTGRSVFIPNNQLMTQSIRNMNYMRRYVNHSFSLVTDAPCFDPKDCKKVLLNNARIYCDEFKDVAQRYNALIEKRLDIKISGPEPSIKLSTTELGKFKMTFSFFCPTHTAKELEQKLTSDFFEKLLEYRKLENHQAQA